MKNTKILVTLIIPLLLISMSAYSYAHFTDTIVKKYKLHVKSFCVDVTSYKAVSRYDDDLIDKYPPDDLLEAWGGTTTISLSTNQAFPGWYVWVGLIIQNHGMYPAEVDTAFYDISDPAGVGVYTEEYFYGPYRRGEFASHSEVWGSVRWRDLEIYGAPPGDVPPPVILEPYGGGSRNKMVMWIYLELTNGLAERARASEQATCVEDFEVQIQITVSATCPDVFLYELGSEQIGTIPTP